MIDFINLFYKKLMHKVLFMTLNSVKLLNKLKAVFLSLFLSNSILMMAFSSATTAETFNNPIVEQRADPWVYKHTDGYYYFTGSVPDYDRVVLRRATTLNGLTSASETTAWWQPTSGAMSGFIWAPELHYVDGAWYIYYAASENNDIWDIRIYVLENTASNPMTGSWTERGELAVDGQGNSSRFFALDATTFEHNSQRYLIWAQTPSGGDSSLWIAEMTSPWAIDQSTTTLIAAPTYAWEKIGHSVNEGASVIKRNGKIFVTYSASATDSNYAIGLLTADENADLLNASSWSKNAEPVFKSSDANSQYGPGHSSFTTSADGTEDVIIYHARNYKDISGESLYDPNRHARGKVFTWNSDGTPNFGIPYADGISGYTSFKSEFSGLCADITGGSTVNGGDLTQWTCTGSAIQKFQLESLTDGYFQLRNINSQRCLDVAAQSVDDGANVAQWDCWGGDNQRWIKEDMGSNTFRLQNKNSGKCLDVFDWNSDAGATLKQWACNSYSVQLWADE